MSFLGNIWLHFCLFLPKGQSQSFDLTNPATTFQTRERGGAMEPENKKSYTLIKQTNNNVQCLWWHTTTLQGALNKSGSYAAPWGPIPIFFRSYESSLHLQTFLLLDLWSQGNGLGGDAFSSIKSSPIIYYIEILMNILYKQKIYESWESHCQLQAGKVPSWRTSIFEIKEFLTCLLSTLYLSLFY